MRFFLPLEEPLLLLSPPSSSSVKFTVTSVCNEYVCGSSSLAAGHVGVLFVFLTSSCSESFVFVTVATDGVQNDGSTGLAAFSSSIAFRAFALSSLAIRASSSSSISNFRFFPLFDESTIGDVPFSPDVLGVVLVFALLLLLLAFTSSPICVISNSRTARSRASSS